MTHPTENPIIPGCGIHHISIQTRDWDASLKLYRDVLGMRVVAEFAPGGRPMILLDTGDGSHIELCAPTSETPPTPADVPALIHLALATSDTRAAIEHVRRAGYEITMEPKDADLGNLQATVGFFKGPNGESIEFFQTW